MWVFKTSPAADHSAAGGQAPTDLSAPMQPPCASCGAPLRAGARYCSDCGAARAAPAESEAAAIDSQFGGSSADLAELVSSGGQVAACPRCDELNKASARYCRHCGRLLAVPGAASSAAHRSALPVLRFYGPEIALMSLLVVAAALWLQQSPPTPASEAARSADSLGVPLAPPAEAVANTAPVDPAEAPAASEAVGEEQEEASPSVAPPGPAHVRTPAPEGTRRKVARPATIQRASAPMAVDDIYRKRAAERCAEGLNGVICREKVRFDLCNQKWTQEAQPGMGICRLNR